ncbi:MAG: HD domain-containing protein [Candidatus Dormibacteraeota bacterium]|nr:HD domain-containing protein [Candidatus Dormibacteraeota bacterium]
MRALYDSLDDAQRTIFALARAVEAKESFNLAHTERVSLNARLLGLAAGLTGSQLEDLAWGGVIHDIGKIAIPDSVLLKPGPLNSGEAEIMRTHVVIGEEIARPLRAAQGVLPIIRHHHERMDGTGYPDRLSGESIPLPARIVAIADAFDALTSDRPYRSGLSHLDAIGALSEGAGTQWDPELVRLFVPIVNSRRAEAEAAAG